MDKRKYMRLIFGPSVLATMAAVFDEFASGTGAAGAVAFKWQQLKWGNLAFRTEYNTKDNTGDLVAQRLDHSGRPLASPLHAPCAVATRCSTLG